MSFLIFRFLFRCKFSAKSDLESEYDLEDQDSRSAEKKAVSVSSNHIFLCKNMPGDPGSSHEVI